MKNTHSPSMDTLRSLLIGAAAGLVLALVFAGGFFLRDVVRGSDVEAQAVSGDYPLLAEVQNLLQHIYLRTMPDQTQLQYGAVRGLLGVLEDKNTFFIDPPVAQSEADTLAGTYGGIGVLLRRDEQARFLLTPYEGSQVFRMAMFCSP
jgi:C-terminal processing protease CtpA/Prc